MHYDNWKTNDWSLTDEQEVICGYKLHDLKCHMQDIMDQLYGPYRTDDEEVYASIDKMANILGLVAPFQINLEIKKI